MMSIFGRVKRTSIGGGGVAALIAVAMSVLAQGAAAQTTPEPWPFAGGDISNSRARLTAASAHQLNTTTAPTLELKWAFPTAGGVYATPTVEQGGLYVPDWGGWLYKLNPDTGAVIWKIKLGNYTGKPYSVSRSSPAIGAQGEIIVGDAYSAQIMSIDRTTGKLIWKRLLDSNTYATVSASSLIYNGVIYAGTASSEESIVTRIPGYQPSFRGRVVALDEATGAVLWKHNTIPAGYTGGAINGSTPVVYAKENALIVGTGNNYTVPASVSTCYKAAGSSISAQIACMDSGNNVDALLSIDLTTGKSNWARRLEGADTWTTLCPNNCEQPAGSDYDFASMPNLIVNQNFDGRPDDRGGFGQGYYLGAGQKNTTYWAVNPHNGGLFGSIKVGVGGIQWGSAVDSRTNGRIYVALNNGNHNPNTLAGTNGTPMSWKGGAWGAIDISTNKFIWQIPAYGNDLVDTSLPAVSPGALVFSNGLVFAGSSSGYMTALNADTGQILWKYATGTQIQGGPALFNDMIYWGTGLRHDIAGQNPNMVYAFGTHR